MTHPGRICSAVVLVSAWLPLSATAVESTRLKDVINSSGIGSIDLFRASVQARNLSPADLEAFREDNDGQLAFAVDVNEAASGLEKSSSQGIALDTARLLITIDGVTHTFDEFTTETRSLIARAGETSRSSYYTLIGDGGSGRITSSARSDINSSSFDATIRMPVNMNLANATAARLEIDLLDTNLALGDPEDFYDYSNGFEDVAIVTAGDAAYLDTLAPGREEAPLVEVVNDPLAAAPSAQLYFPSQEDFYVAAYEDQFPSRGDYDFNDLVVAYRVNTGLDSNGSVTTIGGEGYLVARGGGFDHDWHLRIALPAFASGSGTLTVFAPDSLEPAPGYPRSISFNGALDMKPFENTRNLWTDGSEAFVNTLRGQEPIRGYRFEFEITLSNRLAVDQLPAAPFDPYLYVHNTGYEIHLPGKSPTLGSSRNARDGLSGFTDSSGYPFGMILPEDWLVPVEYVDFGEAYPDFVEFVTSRGSAQTDWHRRPAANATKAVTRAIWKW